MAGRRGFRGGRGSSRGRGRGGAGGRGGRARGGSRGGGRGGVFRGRSSSRGRGGSGVSDWNDSHDSPSHSPSRSSPPVSDDPAVSSPPHEKRFDINKDVRKFFSGTASFEDHYGAQEANRLRYAAGMGLLIKTGVKLTMNSRVRALAAAWAHHDTEMSKAFLKRREEFGVVEVLKAINILDATRQIRVQEKKIKQIELSGGKIAPHKMSDMKSTIENLRITRSKHGSASGAICKHIRRWARTFTKDELEFFALHFPTKNWVRLADICHFHPEKDFPSLPWFLPFCYGSPAPDSSVVAHCENVTPENVNDLVKEYDIPFTHLKDVKYQLTPESMAKIAANTTKLDFVLWNYEDLQCDEVDKIIEARLKDGDPVTLSNGKLLERLLTFKMIQSGMSLPLARRNNRGEQISDDPACFLKLLMPIAQSRIQKIKLPLDAPVVVLGDASPSMGVAIRTSTIIASLLSAICAARLFFFTNKTWEAPFLPETVEQVLQLAIETTTDGSTSPAASLYPFYASKEVVKTFIIVTDEEENTPCNNTGKGFSELFRLYHKEVYPARLVFVSFLHSQHGEGDMVKELTEFSPLQFKFDGSRPDLTKLDTLFGVLSSESKDFDQELLDTVTDMDNRGLQIVFTELISSCDN